MFDTFQKLFSSFVRTNISDLIIVDFYELMELQMCHLYCLTKGDDPIVKVSLLVTCMLAFVYNSAKVGKCYIVNWITDSTLETVNC